MDRAWPPLAFSSRCADIGAGGWRWTSHSPTGSGPEGSSPNERGSGRSSASHLSLMRHAKTWRRAATGWHYEQGHQAVGARSGRRRSTARWSSSPHPTRSIGICGSGPPRPGPRQAQDRQAQSRQAPARSAAPASGATKTRFILLVIGLLAGGLVCLLVINTTLAAAAFRITALQNGNAALAQQQQELQQKVAEEKSASSLERRARALGMRPQVHPNFLNLRTGKIFRSPHSLPGVPSVPGYAP